MKKDDLVLEIDEAAFEPTVFVDHRFGALTQQRWRCPFCTMPLKSRTDNFCFDCQMSVTPEEDNIGNLADLVGKCLNTNESATQN